MKLPQLVLPFALLMAPLVGADASRGATPVNSSSIYFDQGRRDDVLSGGVKMVTVDTPKGKFKVWTKRVGNNPRIKLLLLHGGPGATHEYFEACDSFLPAAGIEYYYYNQLGSAYSDQPDDESLWETARFVEEVEQVRQALGLTRDNFYLLGQSWGGILAIEYALKYQQHLKGLIISNMMASIPAYNDYAKKVLMPAMDQKALAEIQKLEAAKDFANPRYEELLFAHYYVDHLLRMPLEKWPEPVLRMFGRLNKKLYTVMQGPSEMGMLPGCRLEHWDRTADLAKITVPILVIGARHDTMDPAHMEWMAKQFPKGHYVHCPNGSHLALYDDQQTWFSGLMSFLLQVDHGNGAAATLFTPARPRDRDSIRAAFLDWIRVCEAGNADDYVTYVTDDCVIMAPGTAAVVGRAAIHPWVTGFFARSQFRFSDWQSTEIIVHADTAIHRYTGVALLTRQSDSKATRENRQYIDVLRREKDGRWRVSHHIFNVVKAEPK